MRVHRLEIEAFGPFADRVVVDVDALSAEGLFLIHGPTGSGKTSLLDAICFALYADVPGSRSKRGLRSDHAGPDAVPRVTLELTAGTRRLRITRSPEFLRPKKRGTGVVSVQAMVTLEERRGSRWVALSTRNDEVADVVKDALGMGMAQFAKVVLLPQGDFAAFLRATPEDRREVLERLFDISAFSDVEAWLAEARRTAGADLEAARSTLEALLVRVEDVLADAHDAAGDPVTATAEVPTESVGTHLRAVAERLDSRVSTTMAAFDAASGAERAAAEALAAARALDDLRTRGERAVARLETLEAARPRHVERVATLAAAERAAGLRGHLTALDRAVDDVTACRRQVERTREALPAGPLADLPDDTVAEVLARLRALDDTVTAIARETDDAALRARQHAELDDRTAGLAALAERVGAALADAEAEREVLTAEVEERAAGAGRVPELELVLRATRERVTVLDVAERDLARAEALAPRHADLRGTALDRRSELLDLRQRRLDGMAAELARALSEGDPCPVCGGLEHPTPATVSDPVLPGDIAQAEHRLEAAEAQLRSVEAEIESLRTRAGTRLAALDGADRDALDRAVSEATAAVAAARADADARAGLAARLEVVSRAAQEHRTAVAGTVARLEAATAALDDLAAVAAAADDRIRALGAEHADCPCGSPDPAEHRRAARSLTDLAAAVTQLGGAEARLASAAADLDAAREAAGFDDADSARTALLGPTELGRLRAAVTAHVDDIAAARAVTDDPDVVAALAADPPDLPALQAVDRAAREALLTTAAAQDDAARALRSLERLLPLVDEACARVALGAERDARVRELADTTSGTGPDNTLRMRLTAYVLAARLETVATLANERLAVMGGGRYLLEHSDERAARGARSGLGLRVLDQWTGRVRDTATLSGGESFMASLALALGLADAVREEVGGLDLGTLFIDEGFGSLDDDSLEQVLTVLDGLREGGRAVGVVSHVADLRTRITHQAVVHKGASGSTVEVRVGG
ncbi:MAG TPA: SMC family ATPase, partial [Ornithinibacter sp.]|nr:SMC family ATPase [Ornithinibacter sp.]